MSERLSSKFLIIMVSLCFFMNCNMAPVEAPEFKEHKQTTGLNPILITAPYTLVNNDQGTAYEWQSDTIKVRLTGAQTQGLFTLTEDLMKPIFTLGRHLHRTHAETFYILEGEVEFRLGSEIRILRPGTTLHIPPNIPHGLRVLNGQPARLLMLYSPGGFDQYLAEMKMLSNAQFEDEEFMKALDQKYDIIQLE